MTENKAIIYRTTATDIGEKASMIVPERPVLHGCNLKFSAVSTFYDNLFGSKWAALACTGTAGSRLALMRCATTTPPATGKARPSE